ncbi:cysteine desulfurase family protein [Actinocorallia sp. A-T 12471]|uniref:cysteine desulfurase family protein n=1 Tax=Actinocorallia sp. A-T 12471 TaxID=3089813 RepID=UPI0029CE6596|nr:cysteine desulfurase family protein [Actinocorallia sp. A-T 12471]MDX6743210.1 cysteine desulfurase family protein [Actinocorallia sp. A-T 12471]
MPFFDAASTEPLHPAARDALLEALETGWADPARLYGSGRRARMLLDQSRARIAATLSARHDEVSFTTSGTQAVHLGVLGALAGRRRVGRHLVVSAVEHSSVLHAAEAHERDGGEVTEVPVDLYGRVDPDAFAAALRPDTALACLQSANHEVGTVQPVAEAAEACRERGVPLLVDAAQSLGRVEVPGGWSLLTASAHKFGGPAGVGLLVVRKGVRWRSPLPEDERGARRVPGFENVPGAVATAAALEASLAEAPEENARLWELVERVRREVPRLVEDVEVVGDPVRRLPHLVTFSLLYVGGEAIVTELDRLGFEVSSGSSCTADSLRPSHVLEAMGVITHGNVRVSLPRGASAEDVERFLGVLPETAARLRRSAGATG